MIPHPEETRNGSSQSLPKPSLEQLLCVKREERPDDAFWADFDRGLAHKQLAAIVEPRPWWLGLSLVGRRLGALGLPVSAAAAALLAIMVVRTESPLLVTQGAVEFGPVPSTKGPFAATVESEAPVTVKSSALALINPAADVSGESADALPSATGVGDVVSESVEVLVEAADSAAAPVVAEANVPSKAGVAVPSYLAALAGRDVAENQTASQITIAQNLAAVTAETPELVAAISPEVLFAAEDGTVRDASAPVVSSRQARLLAMADMPQLDDADAGIDQVRERMVHRLVSDDSNYSAASRLGYGADRLSLRF